MTRNERELLDEFARFAGEALGLPAKTRDFTMSYLVKKFIARRDVPKIAQREARRG